ncbi:MAG: hypothetical protein ACK463_47990, partial [Bradyrhizobium sp.]
MTEPFGQWYWKEWRCAARPVFRHRGPQDFLWGASVMAAARDQAARIVRSEPEMAGDAMARD